MKIATVIVFVFVLITLIISYVYMKRNSFYKSPADESLFSELNRLFEGEDNASSKSDADTKSKEST